MSKMTRECGPGVTKNLLVRGLVMPCSKKSISGIINCELGTLRLVKPPLLGFVENRAVVDSFITRNGPSVIVVSNVADVVRVDLAIMMRRVHMGKKGPA
jgi:hypothetical protein